MIQIHRSWQVVLLILALFLATLACGLPSPNLGGPTPPEFAPQPSPDALASFNDKWRSLNLATPDGPFTMTFTEGELTSALARAIDEDTSSNNPIPISNPSIILQDGQILMYGTIQLEIAHARGLITAGPSIGENGLVSIDITDAEFGPVAVDPGVIDALEARIAQAINEPIQTSPFHISLNQIQISGGQITINGSIAP
jgi:hypothetical protein